MKSAVLLYGAPTLFVIFPIKWWITAVNTHGSKVYKSALMKSAVLLYGAPTMFVIFPIKWWITADLRSKGSKVYKSALMKSAAEWSRTADLRSKESYSKACADAHQSMPWRGKGQGMLWCVFVLDRYHPLGCAFSDSYNPSHHHICFGHFFFGYWPFLRIISDHSGRTYVIFWSAIGHFWWSFPTIRDARM